VHHSAKFHQNRSNSSEMAIFRFFEVAVIHHLGFVWHILGHPQRVVGCLYHWANFGWSRFRSLYNMNAEYFACLDGE